MPLPPSPNPISLLQIQTEFGGVTPVSISDYYQGAPSGYVTSVNYIPPGQIPTSGPIAFSMFHGVTKLNYVIFYSSGTYTVPPGVTEVQVLAVGGGGGGGGPLANTAEGAGGGGGGAVVLTRTIPVTPSSVLNVTVGAGGAGGTDNRGTSGGFSTFASLVTALGGGSGGGGGSTARPGASGGSGGGGCGLGGATGGGSIASPAIQGEGMQAFGQPGGRGGQFSPGGGGGGAWEIGFGNNDFDTLPAKGGNGANIIMTNSPATDPFLGLGVFGAGGGGGGIDGGGAGWGPGGTGGGGAGSGGTASLNGENGQAGTGSGGGGARPLFSSRGTGGNGGGGVVVVASVEPVTPNNVYPTFQSYAHSLHVNPSGTAVANATITINTDGTISRDGDFVGGESQWFSTPAPGVGNTYWARFDVTTSDFSSSGISHGTTPGIWYQLTSPIGFSASAATASGANQTVQVGGSVLVVISTTNDESGRIATGSFGLFAVAEGDDSGLPPP